MGLPVSTSSIGLSVARNNASTAANAMRRNLAASSRSFVTRARPILNNNNNKNHDLQKSFRRAYADVAPPPAKKARRFRYFRFLWRATYLSLVGGTAYLAYGVWDLRHPEEQFEPDPTKKNLVILGNYPSSWSGCDGKFSDK